MVQPKKGMSRPVTASELAQMGMCERQIVFEQRHGKRSSATLRAARLRGLTAHERFYQDAMRASDKNGCCDIATLILGEGPEVVALNSLRDRRLRKCALGRWLIGADDRSAPAVDAALVRHAWLQPLVRTLIRPVAWVAGYALRHKRRARER